MNIQGSLFFLACMVALTAFYWKQLFYDDGTHTVRWLAVWAARGLLLPVLVWVWLNAGDPPVLPPVMPMPPPPKSASFVVPASAPVPPKPTWFDIFKERTRYVARQTEPAIFVISSYWAALTLGWLGLLRTWNSDDRLGNLITPVIWAVILSPLLGLMIYRGSLGGLGVLSLAWSWPVAHLALAVQSSKPRVPFYSRAIAGMKLGKYKDAEMAIIAELEKCETDFDGWMMLADLYARRFHDLGEAERTVCNLCDDPATSVSQIAVALNRLADWQLEFRGDPERARWALEQIRRRMPGTHLARMAELRLKHLPATSAEWKERQQPKTVHLPALSGETAAARAPDAPPVNRREAHRRADECVEKLNRDPNDIAAREKLAEILADELGAFDQAVEQLESLVEMPEQPEGRLAAWLAQMAAWRFAQEDREAARKILERLVHEHPQSVHAFAAQRRLSLLARDGRAPKRGDGTALAADGPG